MVREYIVRQSGELKAGAYENAPTTAIVVEEIQNLVRCRDCKHCYPCYDSDDSKDIITGWYCNELNDDMFPDFYCGYGERREECGE